MIHRETFQDTVATAKKKKHIRNSISNKKKHRCTSPHGLNGFFHPILEQYIFGSPSLMTTWMVEVDGKLCVCFLPCFRKKTLHVFKNPIFSNGQKLDEFSNLEPLLGISKHHKENLGGCLKEFVVIFSQFVVQWRNTTPSPP